MIGSTGKVLNAQCSTDAPHDYRVKVQWRQRCASQTDLAVKNTCTVRWWRVTATPSRRERMNYLNRFFNIFGGCGGAQIT